MQVVPKLKKIRPLDLTTPHLRVFYHAWDIICQDLVYSCTKFDVCNYTYSRFTEGGLKLKNATLTLTRPLVWYFVTHEMGLYTKFYISSFTRSRFTETERVLKFNFWSLDSDHALFGSISSCSRWYLPRFISVRNLKFLASPVPNLGKGF